MHEPTEENSSSLKWFATVLIVLSGLLVTWSILVFGDGSAFDWIAIILIIGVFSSVLRKIHS